jgi:hypothetical protein
LRGREFQEKKNGKGRNRERESAKATNLPPLITPFRIEQHFAPLCRFKGRRKKTKKPRKKPFLIFQLSLSETREKRLLAAVRPSLPLSLLPQTNLPTSASP